MRGTPSLLLFDREGDLAFHGFGALSHLAVGAEIAGLLKNPSPTQDRTTRIDRYYMRA